MIYLLCRNRVRDFARWHALFTAHGAAQREAGLRLISLARCVEDPDDVFFAFEVSSLERARGFIADPAAARAGEESGVISGEYRFVEDAGGTRP